MCVWRNLFGGHTCREVDTVVTGASQLRKGSSPRRIRLNWGHSQSAVHCRTSNLQASRTQQFAQASVSRQVYRLPLARFPQPSRSANSDGVSAYRLGFTRHVDGRPDRLVDGYHRSSQKTTSRCDLGNASPDNWLVVGVNLTTLPHTSTRTAPGISMCGLSFCQNYHGQTYLTHCIYAVTQRLPCRWDLSSSKHLIRVDLLTTCHICTAQPSGKFTLILMCTHTAGRQVHSLHLGSGSVRTSSGRIDAN